jgi:hypothetical protein
MRALIVVGCVALAASVGGIVEACGSSTSTFDGGDGSLVGNDGAADAPGFGTDGAQNDGNASCNPPDMLVVLDHTDSMSDSPNGTKPADTDAGEALTKWVLACDAVTAVTAPPADQGLRFGLELFPLDPDVITDAGGTGHCETLSGLLSGNASTNTQCMPAEVLVSPNVATGTQIGGILDPLTLKLCVSTPIAAALATAQQALAQIAVPSRKQFILLVTDGGETCVGAAEVISTAQGLAAAGIDTYVVGFGAADAGAKGVNVPLLNDLSCAGMTASGFSTNCVKGDGGEYVASAPNGPPLFFAAEDGASLQLALSTVTKGVCCGCVH